ncbi:transporter substrate-binding domain-containing protein [Pseudomonas aeruginosa]
MKKLPAITALALALISGLAQADRLEDIRKAGVLRVASFDSNPPFGFVDAKSKQIEGLDVDYAKALADKLGVPPFAFTALRNGQVQAITQDGPKLIGLLANVPDRDKYEVPPFTISNDLIGVGIPKGEKALTEFVDKSLRELEQDGQAQKIYDTWFGPQTKTPLARLYKIGDKS